MSSPPYTISVVLNREYGAELRELLDDGPVRAIDSPANREVAQAFWTEFPSRDHLDGLTIFKARDDNPSEQTLIAQLDTIDMHHGRPALHGHLRDWGCADCHSQGCGVRLRFRFVHRYQRRVPSCSTVAAAS